MISVSGAATDLKAAFAAAGYRAYDYIPDNPVVPCVVVGLPTVDYDIDVDQDATTTFAVYAIVAKTYERSAFFALDWALSAVPTAVDTLGPAWRTTRARLQPITCGGVDYAAASFDVEVYG